MTNPRLAVADANPAAPVQAPNTARRLALGAVAGPALFTLAWLVLGFLSPGYTLFGTLIAPYSPISQPISGLGLGPTGAFMNAPSCSAGWCCWSAWPVSSKPCAPAAAAQQAG